MSQATNISYTSLVPEVRRIGPSNLLTPIIQQGDQQATDASKHLTEWFHDINLIWQDEDPGKKEKYFSLERPRSLLQWPEQNPELIFPKTCYSYADYTSLWWKVLYQSNTYYILKFGGVQCATNFNPPSWLYTWWQDFGVNKEEADPHMISRFYHLNFVRDLNFQGPSNPKLYQIYPQNHVQWAVWIQTPLQRQNSVLQYVRKVYTKAWDTLYYLDRFNTHIEND